MRLKEFKREEIDFPRRSMQMIGQTRLSSFTTGASGCCPLPSKVLEGFARLSNLQFYSGMKKGLVWQVC